MRRRLRGLSLLLFLAGLVLVLVGTTAARLRPGTDEADGDVTPRRRSTTPVLVGLALQATGVIGYLIMVSIPRRRQS